MFLAALDQTIIATALPTIGRELGDFEHLPWIVTSYLLTSTAVTPLYGKFSDIHGRRRHHAGRHWPVRARLYRLRARAHHAVPDPRARLQGLGGGGLISLAQTIIADIVAPRERGRYQVYIASVFVSSSLARPGAGRLLRRASALVVHLLDQPAARRRRSRHDGSACCGGCRAMTGRIALDVLGAVLLVAATSLLMLALNWGGVRYPWASPPILGAVRGVDRCCGSASGCGSAARREPLIPLNLFANPVVRMGTARGAASAWAPSSGSPSTCRSIFEIVLGLSASRLRAGPDPA